MRRPRQRYDVHPARRAFLLLVLVQVLLLLPLLLPAETLGDETKPLKGMALVIGQSAYQALPALPNPKNDARAIEELLAKLGFETTLVSDQGLKKLRRSIDGFIDDAEGADVALLYYSGHGIEAGGVNYLIPTEADATSLQAADEELISLQDILDRLRSKARITILLLDACRSNPFPANALLKRNAGTAAEPIVAQGLGAPRGAVVIDNDTAPETLGEVIGFAADPGQVALDGKAGGNSPYAAALLKHLGANQSYDFGQVMTMVTEEVYLATQTRQRPWTNVSLRRFLSFGGKADDAAPDETALTDARRSLLLSIAATPQDMRAAVETLAREQSLPLDPLYGMLEELQVDTAAGPEELDKQLRIGAENLKKLIADKVVPLRKDAELARLAGLADRAEAEGALVLAKSYRLRASARADELDKTLDQREAEVMADRTELAAAYADAGNTATLAFDFRAASEQFGKAYRQVAGRDAVLAFKYRMQEFNAIASHGNYTGNDDSLKEAIVRYETMLAELARDKQPDEWATAQNGLGNALQSLGEHEPGTNTDTLARAALAYHQAISVWTRESSAPGWAAMQNNLGNVLRYLGERTGDMAKFRQSVAAYESALTVITREKMPLEWAMTQNNLGMALIELGTFEESNDTLLRAISILEASLSVQTRQKTPLDWAKNQVGLGRALITLGKRENSPQRLARAIAVLEAAQAVFTREHAPIAWSTVHFNLGDAFLFIAQREKGTATLRKAVAAYEAALSIRKKELYPFFWAPTAFQFGRVLEEMDRRDPRPDILPRVIATYEAVLTVWTSPQLGQNRVGALTNLAAAYARLGQRESGTASLAKAVEIYEKVLGEIPRESHPVDWALAQIGLGIVLRTVGEREDNLKSLPQTIAAFEAALTAAKRDEVPDIWAMTQSNLASTYAFAGKYETGTASFQRAVSAFEAALSVQTSKTSPEAWLPTAIQYATLLDAYDMREAQNGRLARAIGLYEELLSVWTREQYPNEWLTVQTGLATALGKLGERESGIETLIKALAAHDTVLAAISRDNAPLFWARMEMQSGAAKFTLGVRKGDKSLLMGSKQSLEAAQAVFNAAGDKRFDPLILKVVGEIDAELRKAGR